MTSTVLSVEAAELKDNGNKAFTSKAYEDALDFYTRALALAPGNAVLLFNISATHLNLKQWEKALERAEECLAADPSFLKAYGRKAAAQQGLIRPGDAERTLLQGLAIDPNNSFLKEELENLRREDDGDQSPRRNRDGSDQHLRAMQLRMGQMSPFSPWPNKTFMAALVGDEKVFLENFRQEDLRLRALEARLPLTTVVVLGAQRLFKRPDVDPDVRRGSDDKRGSNHSRVLRRLIEAGARVDARDATGWTALHHATAHHAVLDLAQILIEAGADVNAQDRFGSYPLMSAGMAAEVPAVKLLLAHGARADIKDNDGCDVLGFCGYNAEIQSLVHKAHYSNIRPGREKVCANCAATGATKSCSGCGGGVYYCSRECQKSHWPTHKTECRRSGDSSSSSSAGAGAGAGNSLPRELRIGISREHQSTTLYNMQSHMTAALANFVGVAPREAKRLDKRTAQIEREPDATARGLIMAAKRATKQRAMKVKIQVPMPVPAEERPIMMAMGQDPDSMLCYNEDRSMICQLDGTSPAGKQLVQLIRKQGIQGLKGYFSIYFDQDAKQKDGVPEEIVVLTSMLPAQPF